MSHALIVVVKYGHCASMQVKQSVRYTCIASCYHWHGDTKLIFEIGYGAAVGIHVSGSYLKDQLLHTICSSTMEGSVDIAYAVTVLASTVPSIQGNMGNLTSALLTSAIVTIIQGTTTTETVTAPSVSQANSAACVPALMHSRPCRR